MVQHLNIDEANNFFNISFKNKRQYGLIVILTYLFFQESIEQCYVVDPNTIGFNVI